MRAILSSHQVFVICRVLKPKEGRFHTTHTSTNVDRAGTTHRQCGYGLRGDEQVFEGGGAVLALSLKWSPKSGAQMNVVFGYVLSSLDML